MRLVKQKVISLEIQGSIEKIEEVARRCYRSEPKGNPADFIGILRKKKHFAMLEFADVLVTVKTSRAIANEIVRHRIASYAQESTRYVDMTKGGKIEIVCEHPEATHEAVKSAWQTSCDAYRKARRDGAPAEIARDVLPLALATVLVCKWNFSEMGHILDVRLRGATGKPHPDMVDLMSLIYQRLEALVPSVFGDVDAVN